MRQLTIRDEFGLRQLWREQSRNTEGEDTALQVGKDAVTAMFPHGVPSGHVADQLANALADVERHQQANTNPKTGEVKPTPLTKSTLQRCPVHSSVEHLPQRTGAFEMDPGGYRDEYDRPLNKWNDLRKIWEPVYYPPDDDDMVAKDRT